MLLLKNATVYPQTEKAPFVGDVLCENGRIKEIGKDLSADDAETIDLTGLNLLPGIVDCHSHAGLGPNGDVATLSYCTVPRWMLSMPLILPMAVIAGL